MASNDLAIKFSNDVYATKKEVSEYMKTPMIDSIWNSILEYRNNFQILTKLRHITDASYSICLTPAINEKINACERKMMRLYSQYLRLITTRNESVFKKLAYQDILNTVAKNYGLELNEVSCNRILNNNSQALSPELMVVYHYYLALKDIEENYLKEFNKDTLKDFLSIIQGVEVKDFRRNEIVNNLSKTLINKLYLGIPVSSIDKSISDLVNFLKDTNIGMLVKAISSLYFIYYVKPLETYSEEVGVLTLKSVLAHEGLDEIGAMLNFESLLSDKEELEKVIIESQRSLDLTYLVSYVLKKVDALLDEATKYINIAKTSEIRDEMFQEDLPRATEMPDLSTLEEQIEVKSNNVQQGISFNRNVAIENIPTGLSEAEAKRLEDHLLELNPQLSHGQAYFYARHCTLGMSYTISQYKKEVGCAYETARNAMDNLAFLGYYRKELLKNKFIYIPVKRR